VIVDCVFCAIISRREPGFVVYEDDLTIAILDKYPLNRGHVLVMPKEHYENIFETPSEVLCGVVNTVKLVSRAVVRAMNAPGVRLIQNNGPAAGQIIFHIHFHVVPMSGEKFLGRHYLTEEEGREVSAAISRAIGELITEPRTNYDP
jgi:histidine triad (HIT) family protein